MSSSIAIRPFQPQYLSAPRDFVGIGQHPVVLEIGAGKGRHALQFAMAHPDRHLIAIERTRIKFEAMQRLQQQHELKTLTMVHADAVPWVVHALYPQQVQQLFLLYPNPEPHNPAQRWLNMPFFEYLLSRLQADAQIVLASNIASYLDEAEQQLQQVWHLPYIRQQVPPDSARTHFEIKYLARGEPCQQLVLTKPHDYVTRFDHHQPRSAGQT